MFYYYHTDLQNIFKEIPFDFKSRKTAHILNQQLNLADCAAYS